MIAEVRKEPEQTRNIGGGWHTDHSYDEAPASGSMLYAREVPTTGGDTLFASMYAAYDALSDGLKATLEGLRAVHSSRHVFGPEAMARRGDLEAACATPNWRRRTPCIRWSSATREPAARRSTSIRALRCASRAGPTRSCGRCSIISTATRCGRNSPAASIGGRARWRFWDNRSTWHFAVNDYHGERRLLHRITIAGCKLN